MTVTATTTATVVEDELVEGGTRREKEVLRAKIEKLDAYRRETEDELHNQELHEKNKRLKDIDKSLTHEKMRVQDQHVEITDLKEDIKEKGKNIDSLKISADAAKMSKERLSKELTLSKIKVKRLETQISERDSLVHQVQMASAEYQVQVNVNNRKFDQRVDHFKAWLGVASEQLNKDVAQIKEDFNSMQDDILHELLQTKAYIDYELDSDTSFLSKLKVKGWEQGKK